MLCSWPCDNPYANSPLYHLLATTHCAKKEDAGDHCAAHRLVVCTVEALQVVDTMGFYFPGEVTDMKATQDMAVVMVRSTEPELDEKTRFKCYHGQVKSCGENPGYLFFYKLTKKNWYPTLLFRSSSMVSPSTATPWSSQWGLNESKIVFRESDRAVTEVTLYWYKKLCAALMNTEKTKCSSLSLGCHGDYFTSWDSSLTRHTSIITRKYQKAVVSQCLMRS